MCICTHTPDRGIVFRKKGEKERAGLANISRPIRGRGFGERKRETLRKKGRDQLLQLQQQCAKNPEKGRESRNFWRISFSRNVRLAKSFLRREKSDVKKGSRTGTHGGGCSNYCCCCALDDLYIFFCASSFFWNLGLLCFFSRSQKFYILLTYIILALFFIEHTGGSSLSTRFGLISVSVFVSFLQGRVS